jgi:REP element-mobilizing transposase RayT
MSNLAPESYYRRNLPHIQPPGATLFVTFRLAGSIPLTVLQTLHEESERVLTELECTPDSPVRAGRIYREQRRFFGRWDAVLDAGSGPNWLRRPEVAALVADAMHHFDGQRYDLPAFCIMPNHVHWVITPLLKTETEYYSLASIMHSIKSYTAGRANKLLGRTGAFWQHESHDHFVRNAAELERIIAYVLHNPVKAGLVTDWQSWPWTYVTQSSGLYNRKPEAHAT